jgi:hypothetical protein
MVKDYHRFKISRSGYQDDIKRYGNLLPFSENHDYTRTHAARPESEAVYTAAWHDLCICQIVPILNFAEITSYHGRTYTETEIYV